jgi:hypothetical protein
MLEALQNAFKITKINYGLIITVRRSDQACEDAATAILILVNSKTRISLVSVFMLLSI